jgi:opacity protein-like surface antigen
MNKSILGIAAVAMMAIAPASASAQMPINFGALGGASIPIGDFGDVAETGWHLGGFLAFRPAMMPFGLRAEGVYHRFSAKDDVLLSADSRTINVNLNGLWEFSMAGSPMQPYAIGGFGLYNSKATGDDVDDESSNDLGVNVGGGVRFALSGFSAFVEARYHNIFTEGNSTQMIPLSFGFTFGGGSAPAPLRVSPRR